MQSAFRDALLHWAQRETRAEQPIALPAGAVDPVELRKVTIALVCAREAPR
jgi:hypothetical protein